ncbi:MAG: alpha/beta hydrolase [Hyphomonas sp.]|uniref:alpha/beta fold hydrolase n=1 Tax=Hyphomonas sp. TaxID=87 RepID=UPI001852B39D|nr:alpha/beta hydrolase [Hyphomonas sp.]MBA3069072.1 alpha/beta hydrolase [Hyphomonas sp.]MBU3920888.1 alpha/beta hydrolase [Alphaproteobacteria bacterium]MBU4061706.1 alpha/beta hydrolase [Alphaproteobacteria bacterium]MBU4163551.1 alpha/beta hydrolase [Alphaproteobacteria bacterium]
MMTILAATLSALGLGACVTSMAYTSKVERAFPAGGTLVRVDGRDVHVILQGTASPVVLMIHGASANAREFTWTLAPRLDADMRVLMADRPGHGYSERFGGAEQLGAQARQMAGVLDALAPGEKAVIVGHSFGGAVALRLALDRPDLVSGLVLLAPVTHDWGSGGTAWYNSFAAPPVFGEAFSQLLPMVGPSQVRGGISSVFDPAPAPEGYFENSAIGLLFRPANFRANARDVIALREELRVQSARYPELKVPITVFSGSQDTVISPKLHVGELRKQVQVDLVILAHEGHMPHHGEGEAVADAIRHLARRL